MQDGRPTPAVVLPGTPSFKAFPEAPPVRIYADESGTHSDEWLVIGMLFVRDHGSLHRELCEVKTAESYLNNSPKRLAYFRELHFADISSRTDVAVAKGWLDLFVKHDVFFRCVVVDWTTWDGRYFGGPFEADSLKKRRAYKKWAELLLQPEVNVLSGAEFYLDELRELHRYDVIPHLQERFTGAYLGNSPRITKFQHTKSWKDANQALQLCDLLVGAVYRSLVPPTCTSKLAITNYTYEKLEQFGVKAASPSFWKGYASPTIRERFPKFSQWFWTPTKERKRWG